MVLAAVISLALLALILWAGRLYSLVSADLPTIENLALLLDGPDSQLQQPTAVYARDGESLLLVLQNPNAAGAQYIPLSDIPAYLVDATLAASDPNFWQHSGSHYQLEEQPTLAQRLVNDLLLWSEAPNMNRNYRSMLLAAQATSEYGREKILEWYLNSTYYGQSAYGLDEASRVYFGKPAIELSLAEAAMLAATAEAPALNPIDAPEVAVQRQGAVLQAMLGLGFIDLEQAMGANAQPIQVMAPAIMPTSIAPDFTKLLVDQLHSYLGEARVGGGGLKVVSTLDPELQMQTKCALDSQLSRLYGGITTDQLSQEKCEAARLLPGLNQSDMTNDPAIHAGAVVMQPSSGQVLALVGNPYQGYKPGSILTPFVYLTAFTRGLNPASLVWDIPSSVPDTLDSYGNFDGEFHGPMRIRTALVNDYIVPALSTLTQVGPANVWRTAQQSGLAGLPLLYDDQAYHLLLDSGQVNLLELTHAYSMMGNQGVLTGQYIRSAGRSNMTATTILMVTDSDGRTVLDFTEAQQQAVVSPQLAYLVTDVLADDAARRQALGHPNSLEIGRPAAVKLGRTFSGDSTWTVGYSPQYCVGVWLGRTAAATQKNDAISPQPAAGLWHALMKIAHAEQPARTWQQPLGISRVNVCDPSGLLPTDDCPSVVEEIFLSGTEPLLIDNLYQNILINSQTGRLATVHTPQEFVESRVFLIVPPEAREWARSAGLEIPPDDYDVIFNPADSRGAVMIRSPQMFTYISGVVEVRGRASSTDMDYYRVQIGEGLNPRQWLQIGSDSNTPVEDGMLVQWDTRGLNGLYAVQLLLVEKDQSVVSATIQVTVDNRPPSLQITAPAEGQHFSYPQERQLTFQALVTDDIGVDLVEFYIDGQQIANLTETPYSAIWQGTVGKHTLKVVAVDLAGNLSEDSVVFELNR